MGNEEGLEEFEVHARNMDTRGKSGMVSNENEDCFIGNWKKDNPCKGTRNLEEKHFSVLWKVEFVSEEIKFLAKWISKQSLKKQHSSS